HLEIRLCTASGRELMVLPITQMIDSVDPYREYNSQGPRASKLILVVADGGVQSNPIFPDTYAASRGLVGVKEDLQVVRMQPRDLPENVLGYQAVDAIVWLNGTAPDPNKQAEAPRMHALQEYIRRGGRLVVSQPAEAGKTEPFAEMLPVVALAGAGKNAIEMVEKGDLLPLSNMGMEHNAREPETAMAIEHLDPWLKLAGPFKFARAQAVPGAMVEEWIKWDVGDRVGQTPYLARVGYGLGSVSWVANDLGDPAITLKLRTGWPTVWTRIFDFKDDPYIPRPTDEKLKYPPKYLQQYAGGNAADIGASLNTRLELASKTAGLVSIAVLFFIFYWIVVGPGLFFYLRSKGKPGMNWFGFGAGAIAATVLTVLIVKVVLRGAPEIKHLSIVQMAPGQPTVVHTRFGLYIPRDGDQQVALDKTISGSVSCVSPLAAHPGSGGDSEGFITTLDYEVPVPDPTTNTQPSITVPFRSTLKKMQATWVGNLEESIEGAAKITRDGPIERLAGTLANNTAHDLVDVFFIYRTSERLSDEGGITRPSGRDQILYLPFWKRGDQLDLDGAFRKAKIFVGEDSSESIPGRDTVINAKLEFPGQDVAFDRHLWARWMYEKDHGVRGVNERFDD
ncbi:MAG TPA: hypothetical protein VIL86_20245, partial [Tepidisphaeraceae bacterium]